MTKKSHKSFVTKVSEVLEVVPVELTPEQILDIAGQIPPVDISGKVDKETGKGLSTNDYTNDDKDKLSGIDAGAEVNNISDVNAGLLTGGQEITLHSHAGGSGGGRNLSIELLKDANYIADTNSPVALRFYLNRPYCYISKADLTGFTQVRLVSFKAGTSGATNYKMILKYIINWSATAGNWLDIGTSEVSVTGNVTNQPIISEWINLCEDAKADVFVALMTSGGDGVLDPQWGHVTAEFK